MCSTACDTCSPLPPLGFTRTFKPGNIVRFKGAPATSAAPGSVALVYGYKLPSSSPSRIVRSEPAFEYVQIFWLDSLAGAQSNGGYNQEDFELMHESPTSYRPDYRPEDRGLNASWAAGTNIKALRGAVEIVRASGARVTCTVEKDETVTTTTTERTEL